MMKFLRIGDARTLQWALGILLGGLLWFTLWLLLIVGQLGHAHSSNAWVKGAYEVKRAAAVNFSGKRNSIVVGGSASMFGVDSQLLASLTGLPAVNFGVNAGIGTYALPALADPYIESGDVVVMPIEYMLLLWDGRPDYVSLSWALEHPSSLERWGLVPLLVGFWRLPVERVYEGYFGLPEPYLPSGTYGPHRLDRQGDQLRTRKAEQTSEQLAGVERLKPVSPLLDRVQHTTLGLQEWGFWWSKWEARGACLLIVPPPFLEHPEYHEPEWQAFFRAIPSRVSQVGGDYAGQPADTFFLASDMFDTAYHLTSEARNRYTRWLAHTVISHRPECFQPPA